MEWRAVGAESCPPFPGGRLQADLTASPCGDRVREVLGHRSRPAGIGHGQKRACQIRS